MRSLFVAAALAVTAALGLADTASAQYFGYNVQTYDPWTGGVVGRQTTVTPFGAQTAYGVYNPITGYTGQTYGYADAFGNRFGGTNVYNPVWGQNYSVGYGYNPYLTSPYLANPYLYNPYMGYRTNPYLGYRGARGFIR